MASGSLWALDGVGRAWRLRASASDELGWVALPCVSCELSWLVEARRWQERALRRLAAAPRSVWAIGADGRPYVWVASDAIILRVVEQSFENQRWYPVVGYSKTLPTDRNGWSTQDGAAYHPREAISLPSDGWSWEDPWSPDLNPNVADKSGWQYAVNFNATFHRATSAKALVRRRRWVRSRRYTAVERWNSLHHPSHLVDIAVGGWAQSGAASDSLSVWAVTRAGQLSFRAGVCERLPEGEQWQAVESVVGADGCEDELSQVSCSPLSGRLWALTWDGRLFERVGVGASRPSGLSWSAVASPHALPLLSVTVGESVAWAVTVDGRVWTAKLDGWMLCSTSWLAMRQDVCRFSVTVNEQVFGIGQSDRQICLRTGVNVHELGGREWKRIALRRTGDSAPAESLAEEADDSRSEAESTMPEDESASELEWVQVAAGAVDMLAETLPSHWLRPRAPSDAHLAANDRRAEWRRALADSLRRRNSCINEAFWDFVRSSAAGHAEAVQWEKRLHCSVRSGGAKTRWKDADVELTVGDTSCLTVDYKSRSGRVSLEMNTLCAVIPWTSANKGCLSVYTAALVRIHRPLNISFPSLEEQSSWASTLVRCLQQCHPGNFVARLWCAKDDGAVFAADSAATQGLWEYRWLPVVGCLAQVSAGGEGVVWGLGHDGRAWCMVVDGASFREMQEGARQTDAIVEEVCENQRLSPLFGYVAVIGIVGVVALSTGFTAWSDASGKRRPPKDEVRLSSRHWQWDDAEWKVDVSPQTDGDGWRYAAAYHGPYQSRKSFAFRGFRRRRWTRRRRFAAAAPWTPVEAPPLARVAVERGGRRVWAVTRRGEALCRVGVSAERPAGTDWRHVIADQPTAHLCAGPRARIWAVDAHGSPTIRYCANEEDLLDCAWLSLEKPPKPLKAVAAGSLKVWALDVDGNLYSREGVSDGLPEGVKWTFAYSDISAIAIDRDDSLFVLMDYSEPGAGTLTGVIAKLVETPPNSPYPFEWQYGFAGPWTSLSAV